MAEDCAELARTRSWVTSSQPQPWDIISTNEFDRASHYITKFWERQAQGTPCCHFDDLFFHTGDNPTTASGWCTWSASSGRLPTLRRSSGLILSGSHNQQVLLRELYAAHGFPAFEFLARAADVAKYQVFFAPFTTYSDSKCALGNAQHVAQVGVFMATSLVCARLKQQPGVALYTDAVAASY